MGKFLKTCFALLVLAAVGAYLFLHFQWGPYGKGANVYIPKGSSASRIAETLEREKVVRRAWVFKIFLRLSEDQRPLQSGEYQFAGGENSSQILRKLQNGDRVYRKLVVPEGYRFQQIRDLIVQARIANYADVERAFTDARYLSQVGFPAQNLEGYLFPMTYDYDRGTTLDDLLTRMIRAFKANFTPAMQKRGQDLGLSAPQVVALAAIIERETGQEAERARVSGVFHNRLRKGMLLQSDPTVIYGLRDYDGDIKRADLQNPHPFNTYVHPGLTPTPIASPGRKSLEAALNPLPTDELYFVGIGNGFHYFSRTLEEHNQAVQRYQVAPQDLSDKNSYHENRK